MLQSRTGFTLGAALFFMAQNTLSICNSALMKIGERAITSLSEASKGGEIMSIRFPVCRDFLLRAAPWKFAKAAATLAPLSNPAPEPTVFGFTYAFNLPSDTGRILSLTMNGDRVPYEQVAATLYASSPSPLLRYIRVFSPTENVFSYPDDFAEVLATYLAADVCVSFTQNMGMRGELMNQYEYLLSQARHHGAVDLSPQTEDDLGLWTTVHENPNYQYDIRLRPLDLP